jgi:hypothetical protein
MPTGLDRVVRRHGKMDPPLMSPPKPQQQEMGYTWIAFEANGYGQEDIGMSMQQQELGEELV